MYTNADSTEVLDKMLKASASKSQVYVGSVPISERQIEAAERIAWLRTYFNTDKTEPEPQEGRPSLSSNALGALGEVICFDLLRSDARVRAVSLVSCKPVIEADIVVQCYSLNFAVENVYRFDIKTSRNANPGFWITYESHLNKLRPDILCVVVDRAVASLYIIPQSTFELDLPKLYITGATKSSWKSLSIASYHQPAGRKYVSPS